jgi:GMP synthase (glutamine-hydrolysing)
MDTLGIVPQVLASEGLDVAVVEALRGETLPSPADVSGLVLFGGEMNADQIDRFPYLARERALAREAIEAGLPVLGICLGSQLLARSLDVPVVRSPVREIGFCRVRITAEGRDDPLLSAFASASASTSASASVSASAGETMAFQWHEDTYALPPGATLLATGADVPMQAFRVANAWGVQFHFEITAEEIESWLATTGPSFEATWGRSPDEIRRQLREHVEGQQRRGRELLSGFAEVVRSHAGAGVATAR